MLNTARVAGYLLVSFAEPLLILAYLFRFLRIKKIFDAQAMFNLTNANTERHKLIAMVSEENLATWAVVICAITTAVYLIVGFATAFGTSNQLYGVLPTYALSLDEGNEHMYVSLIFFVITTFIEGLLFAYFLDQVRGIKREFSMLPELQMFTFAWIGITDLVLFFVIQGISAQWFSNVVYYRIMFWMIIIRQITIALITTVPPLRESFNDNCYFPFPANRECIEQVDQVLHIPIALDFFYNYLYSRSEYLKDK